MQLGVIGLGTMGANLARNAARNGAKVPVFNRTTKTMTSFMKEYGSEGNFVPCETYEELIAALTPPRAILIMVKAGDAVDAVIEDLLPHLDKGDIIIDGGNSHYPNTERRVKDLSEKGIRFLGMGVSGGEEGALLGPSIMPGGDESAYEALEPLLLKMAAEIQHSNDRCVAFMGEGGAGHFVKMVHNGVEYGVMQLIAEAYDILKSVGGFDNEQLAETFDAWKDSKEMGSYLLEITANIFKKQEGEEYLIDLIKDAAGQKGTGKWTTEAALHYGVAIPTINAAVDARIISGSEDERTRGKTFLHAIDVHDPVPMAQKLRSMTRCALELSTISAYHQGFRLIEIASQHQGRKIDLSEVARIWRGGCIIRSVLLERYQRALSRDKDEADAASDALTDRFDGERQLDWRRTVQAGISRGVPVPAMSASLSYFDSLLKDSLPQNLIQAQRDYFGAHTYERTDKKGTFHTEW